MGVELSGVRADMPSSHQSKIYLSDAIDKQSLARFMLRILI
jgi:hypothetical protein